MNEWGNHSICGSPHDFYRKILIWLVEMVFSYLKYVNGSENNGNYKINFDDERNETE